MRKRLLEQERVRFAIQVLRDAGMRGVQIEDIMLGRHSEVCACWDCVLRLRNEVTMHRAKLVAKARWQLSQAKLASSDADVAEGAEPCDQPGQVKSVADTSGSDQPDGLHQIGREHGGAIQALPKP